MNIVIIGSGNIATHIAKALYAHGNIILQVYNRTLANATALAKSVNSQTIDLIQDITTSADLYIIAVSDSAIESVVTELPSKINGIVVHTSGATPIDVLSKFSHYGVIYPPQSLNKDIASDLSSIPFGIEANNPGIFNHLYKLVSKFAPKCFACDSKQRLTLHIAAVIANNFTNALFQMAETLMTNQNLDFNLLKPIILETALKVQQHSPHETQTGPARRGDYNVINKHLELLSQYPEEREIYQLLTDFIVKRYHN